MDDATLDQFLAHCCERLEQRQTALAHDCQLDRCDAFHIDLEHSQLSAMNGSETIALATIIPIASYDPHPKQWQWAWANSELPSSNPQATTALQNLSEKTGLSLFQAPQFQADLDLMWELVAMACEQLEAAGCYRWKWHTNQYLWLTLHDVMPGQIGSEAA